MTFYLVGKISNNSLSPGLRNKITMNYFYYSVVSRIYYNFISTHMINKQVNNI